MIRDALHVAMMFGHVSLCCFHNGDCVAGTLSAKAGSAHRGWVTMVKLREGEGVKRPCRLHLSVSQNQWRPEHRVSITTQCQIGKLFTGPSILALSSLCVYVETVILGCVSPGSAGSAHWTESSSDGQPESHPSWIIHYEKKNDRKKHRLIYYWCLLRK